MEIRQLKTFKHLTQCLSFSRTADELGYAQSTVSTQIRDLEREFGVVLFDRLDKKVSLTDAGFRFQDYANKLLAISSEMHNYFEAYAQVTGKLSIYAPSTLYVYRLPVILRAFRQEYPDVELIVHSHLPDLYSKLRHGEIDLAFVLETAVNEPDMVSIPLLPEEMTIAALPNHPLAKTKQITFADLENCPLVLSEPSCGYRQTLERMAAEDSIRFNQTMGLENTEAIKQCVLAGLGVTFLPRVAIAQQLESGELVELELDKTIPAFTTQMVYHKDKWVPPAMARLIDTARTIYQAPASQ